MHRALLAALLTLLAPACTIDFRSHLTEQKLKARGGVFEVFWTDPGMVPDPAKWRTQIFAPIE